MKRDTTPVVEAISKMAHVGNIINPLWLHWLKQAAGGGTTSAASVAALVLSDIIYWYQFTESSTQYNYDDIAEKWAITKRQAKNAVDLLVQAGIVKRELRTVVIDGRSIPNVIFLEPVPESVNKISNTHPNATGEP